MTALVDAVDLSKRFGSRSGAVQALDQLSITAPAGGVVAILGPNGAGKSTLVRMVATLDRPDSGQLHVCGIDVLRQPQRVRATIGLAGQYAAVEEAMTGRENLEMVARLFGRSRRDAKRLASDTLERLSLTDSADRLVRGWSGGMRRRLDLGATLVGDPRVLLLDEPTTGLDPASRLGLWDAVRDLVARGTDVLLTTQYLEEADQLADHVVIIDRGRTIASGTPAELKSRTGGDVVEVRPRHPGDATAIAAVLTAVGGKEPTIDPDEQRISVPVDSGTAALADLVRRLDAAGIEVDDLALRRPTLDEVFVNLTSQSGAHR